MASFTDELKSTYDSFQKMAPEPIKQAITAAREDFVKSYDPSKSIQVGEILPEFKLSDALGKEVTSTELLAKGPLLINFYRGEWCPFCNVTLRTLQRNLGHFTAKGVVLVAISPELPNNSLSIVEKHALEFPVLSDVGNKYAKQLAIVFQQPDSLRAAFSASGIDLKAWNGDDSFAVPIPATLLVDKNGVIRKAFIEPDYTKRIEPAVVLEWIQGL
jgi:peroxiredoxin